MIDNANLTDHTVAVYASSEQAHSAIKKLSDSGFDMKGLSIIGQNYSTEEHPVGFINVGDRMLSWGKLGAFWGAIWGLLFGSAMMFVPGAGVFILAGWIVGALEGGALVGGLAAIGGALASIGIPKNSVVEYESALKAGSFLVLVHGSDAEARRAKDSLAGTQATRIDSYSTKQLAASR